MTASPANTQDHKPLPQNVHVKAIHLFFRVFVFLTTTPLMLLLICCVVIPMIAGAGKKSERYLEYLKSVTHYEREIGYWNAFAAIGVSQGKDKPLSASELDTHYKNAERIVRSFFPESWLKKRGMIVGADDPTKTMDDKLSDSDVVGKMNKKMQEYIDDNFFLVFYESLIMVIARGGQIISMAILFLPLLVIAWFIGEAKSRADLKRGIVPKAARATMLWRMLQVYPPTIVALPFIPVAMNVVVVAPIILSLFAINVYLFRANMIEI